MPEALPALGVFAVCAVLIALSYAYRNTFGYLLEQLGGLFVRATIHLPVVGSVGFAFIGHAILSLDNAIRDALAQGIQGTEWAWHRVLHVTALAWQETAAALDDVATATEQALGYLVKHRIPQMVAAALSTALLPFGALVPTVAKLVQDVSHLHTATVTNVRRVEKHIVNVTYKLPPLVIAAVPNIITKAVTVPLPRIGQLEREAGAAKAKLGKIARTLTPAGIVGLVLAGAGALKLGWTRCSNVNRLGKHVCGMDRGQLENLLAGTALVLGTVDLVEYAKGMQTVTEEITKASRIFWRV